MKNETAREKFEKIAPCIDEFFQEVNEEEGSEFGVVCVLFEKVKHDGSEEFDGMKIHTSFCCTINDAAHALVGASKANPQMAQSVRLANLRMNPLGDMIEDILSRNLPKKGNGETEEGVDNAE